MMKKALSYADQVLLEGRERVRGLRSEGATASELSEMLASYGNELARDREVAFKVTIVGSPVTLHPVVRDEVYRIAREALANAFLHSRASSIEVEITYDSATFVVRVRDNGCGIDEGVLSSGREGHWGISGMRGARSKRRWPVEHLEQYRRWHGGGLQDPGEGRVRAQAGSATMALDQARCERRLRRMTATSKIRVLTVDDHPLLRSGIAAVLEGVEDIMVAGEATNGKEAVESFRVHRPDVTLMDLQMPVMNGIDAILAIRREFPGARNRDFDHLRWGRPSGPRLEGRGCGVPSEEYASRGTGRHDSEHSCRPGGEFRRRLQGKSRSTLPTIPLTNREIEVLAESGHGNPQQGHCFTLGGIRVHRPDSSEEHPFKARGQRQDARRDHCDEAGIHRRMSAGRFPLMEDRRALPLED